MGHLSLPFEILEAIMDAFASVYSDTNEAGDYKYLPRWYLTPLLRVCKMWNVLAEKRLYQHISIGMNFSRTRRSKIRRRALPDPEALPVRRYRFSQVAKGLLATLSTHPHLAALVEDLRLGIKDSQHAEAPEWTETHTRLIQVCPNLKHADIRGFARAKRDGLVEALRLKEISQSLVSFRISPQGLSGARSLRHHLHVWESFGLIEVLRSRLNIWTVANALDAVGIPVDDNERETEWPWVGMVENQFSLTDLLVILPELWAVSITWLPTSTEQSEPYEPLTHRSDSLDSFCAPRCHDRRVLHDKTDYFQDISFTGRWLRCADLKLLLAITTHSHVKRLDIGIWELRPDDLALEALCECLHAWSRTVESVRLNLFTARHSAYQLLFEALSMLTELRELEIKIQAQSLEFSSIADLPRLERVSFAPRDGMSEEDVYDLSRHLQDSNDFRALRQLAIYPEPGVELGSWLENVCLGRGIKLERWPGPGEGQKSIPGFVL